MTPITILLVEDNEDDEFLTLNSLKRSGFTQVSVARDGKEAVDILSDPEHPLPDLLLLDLRLPKIDGLEVMAILRRNERSSNLPIIILSSSEDPVDLEVSRKLGAFGYLSKPLVMPEFLNALNTVCWQ